MKTCFRLLSTLLLLLTCLPLMAADSWQISRSIHSTELQQSPQVLNVFIYDQADAAQAVQVQRFESDQWRSEWADDEQRVHIQARLTGMDEFDAATLLWAEVEVDGQLVSERFELRAVVPSISVKGYVESLVGGFKFPDESIQITATDTSVLQSRVTGSCAKGSSIRIIDSAGAVTCELDTDTNTNAATICPDGSFLKGDRLCYAGYLDSDGIDADTNAATICPDGSFLKGDGLCYAGYLDSDGIDTNTTYTALTGLNLVGTAFSVDSKVVARKDVKAGNQAFDTDTLYLDYFFNRVGIGDATPNSKLDVNGVVAASNYVYRSTKTYHQYIGVHDFNVEAADMPHGGFYRFPTSTATNVLYADIDLPQSADILKLTCYYYDNDTGADIEDMDFKLYSRAFYSTSSNVLVSAATSTTGNSSAIRSTASGASGAGDPVDNANYAYAIMVLFDLTNESIASWDTRFYGCNLTYTLDEVSH